LPHARLPRPFRCRAHRLPPPRVAPHAPHTHAHRARCLRVRCLLDFATQLPTRDTGCERARTRARDTRTLRAHTPLYLRTHTLPRVATHHAQFTATAGLTPRLPHYCCLPACSACLPHCPRRCHLPTPAGFCALRDTGSSATPRLPRLHAAFPHRCTAAWTCALRTRAAAVAALWFAGSGLDYWFYTPRPYRPRSRCCTDRCGFTRVLCARCTGCLVRVGWVHVRTLRLFLPPFACGWFNTVTARLRIATHRFLHTRVGLYRLDVTPPAWVVGYTTLRTPYPFAAAHVSPPSRLDFACPH